MTEGQIRLIEDYNRLCDEWEKSGVSVRPGTHESRARGQHPPPLKGECMKATVSFSFSTAEEKRAFEEYAREKGMKLSALAKMALYQYRAKYPHKEAKNGGPVVVSGWHDAMGITAQPTPDTGDGSGEGR